jgi:hypothetical protein
VGLCIGAFEAADLGLGASAVGAKGGMGATPYVSTPSSETKRSTAEEEVLGAGAARGGGTEVCRALVQGGRAMNWSNSRTGLFVSLQHDHDLRPS